MTQMLMMKKQIIDYLENEKRMNQAAKLNDRVSELSRYILEINALYDNAMRENKFCRVRINTVSNDKGDQYARTRTREHDRY
ncbi:MAG: hypothetical protein WA749_13850 [Gelidibacter sp.]